MLIKFSDPVSQTIFFSILFFLALILSVRKSQEKYFFSKEVTTQIKGLAILAIIFSHIGYFLSTDNRFLYPLSVLGGVGVNLFLFLSGFGLNLSQLKNPLPPLVFYKKRLSKLFLPLWIIIILILLLDFVFLGRTYSILEVVQGLIGFFPRADLFQNLNSPLWYLTINLFFYFLFPLISIRKAPLISPFLILALTVLVLRLPLPVHEDVLKLYKLHFLAFPIGMCFALVVKDLKFNLNPIFKLLILVIAVLVLLYTAINSDVGGGFRLEQSVSLITAASIITIFSLVQLNFKLLSLFGLYSYEIYLIHWPILSRYNLLSGLPPFLMVILNLVLFMLLAYLLQHSINFFRSKYG